MKSILRLGLLLALVLLPANALAIEPVRPGQEDSLIRGIYSEGRLWLLSDAGQLFSFAETDKQSRPEDAGEPVHDICVVDGQLVALTATGKTPNAWNMRRHTAEGWSAPVPIETHGEWSVALICEGGSALVVTNARLLTISGGQVSEIALTGEMNWGVASTLATANAIYIGFDRGEWGGGLKRIDRTTGKISQVENLNGELCGGLLNTGCDPVNGLAVLPWRADCIAAAIGLIHFVGHGRIVTICGDKIEQLYVKQYGQRFPNKTLQPEEAYPTIPFFGLMPADGKLVAVGADGLYTLGSDGKAAFEEMPAFKKIGPFRVSFAKPGIVLVLTTVNRRTSVSGAVPMLVAR